MKHNRIGPNSTGYGILVCSSRRVINMVCNYKQMQHKLYTQRKIPSSFNLIIYVLYLRVKLSIFCLDKGGFHAGRPTYNAETDNISWEANNGEIFPNLPSNACKHEPSTNPWNVYLKWQHSEFIKSFFFFNISRRKFLEIQELRIENKTLMLGKTVL